MSHKRPRDPAYPPGSLRVLNFGKNNVLVYADPAKAPVAGPYKSVAVARRIILKLEGRR